MDDESKPNILLTGNRVLGGNKTKMSSWLPKKLRKLSIIRDKNKKTPNEEFSEEASSSNQKNNPSKRPDQTSNPEGKKPQPEY